MQRVICILLAAAIVFFSWSARAAAGIWQEVTPAQPGARSDMEMRYFQADDTALRNALENVPHEASGRRDHHLSIPMPDGSQALFSVQESPVASPEVQREFPEIKTFRIYGVDDPDAAGVINITPLGFRGMLQTAAGRIFVDPDDFAAQNHIYRSRFARSEASQAYQCGVDEHSKPVPGDALHARRSAAREAGSLLQYDLAVAVTLEYHQLFGGDVGNTMAQVQTTISRVNFIYERDHGIRLRLVSNDQVFETSESGLLDNEDEFRLLGQVDAWIDARITGGDGAYDIGHMFSRPAFIGGGVANIGAVCNSSIKAGGVSGMPNPRGDSFNVDLVAHEIGHQFNAEHSFNGTTSACINRNGATAWEPGSGSSVMAYSGICAGENLQSNADAGFHAGSIAQVHAFTTATATCYDLVDTTPANNNDPVIGAIASSTIPANTPFLLGDPAGPAVASDADLDTLEYRWDQMDAGCPTDGTTFGTDNGSNALFRSYAPRADSWRNFPALGTQVANPRRYDKAEVLPCHSRALDFRLTVTDGNSGQDFVDVRVNVDSGAGPFVITNLDPDPGLVSGDPFQVDWDPAGTDAAPISCASVDIDLLAFNPTYSRYTVYPLGTAANSSTSATVTVTPDTASHERARIRVKCSDNIFYDVSDRDLNITAGSGPGVPLNDSALVARVFADIAITDTTAPSCPAVVDCSPPPTSTAPAWNTDASAFELSWLLWLAGLAALGRLWRCQGRQWILTIALYFSA